MENIYENYRNIIERAVLAGIIPKENKQYYLSALQDEKDSDLQELESRLSSMQEEIVNSDISILSRNDDFHPLFNEHEKSLPARKKNNILRLNNEMCKEDLQSIESGDTIENYNIFDFKNSICHSFHSDEAALESNSDLRNVPKDTNRASTVLHNSATVVAKVMKKPQKDQVIDFNIPIYIDVKKKKAEFKPCISQSKPIHSKYQVSDLHDTKKNNSKLQENGAPAITNKWTLNLFKSKVPITKQTKFHSPVKNSNLSNRYTDYVLGHIDVEKDKNTILQSNNVCNMNTSHKNGINSLRKPYQEFSSLPTNHDELHEAQSGYTYPKSTNATQISKDHKDKFLKEKVNRMKVKHPPKPSHTFLHRRRKKTLTENVVQNARQIDNCESCKCICSCKAAGNVLKANNSSEAAASGDDISSTDVPESRQHKDHERLLNVNIICQFYPNDESDNLNDDRCPENVDELKKVEEEKAKADDQAPADENEKSGRSKTIQRLSKLFANMKTNKKPKRHDML